MHQIIIRGQTGNWKSLNEQLVFRDFSIEGYTVTGLLEITVSRNATSDPDHRVDQLELADHPDGLLAVTVQP
jgi:hypothetical protein